MTDDEAIGYRVQMLERSNERLEKKFDDLRSTLMSLMITVITATVVVFVTFVVSMIR